jgi:hypothetical protein
LVEPGIAPSAPDLEGTRSDLSGIPNAQTQPTYLYQKVGPNGEHLKFGITKNSTTRYTKTKLGGGRLRLLAHGARNEMLRLERDVHEILPVGSEERQPYYLKRRSDND